MTRQDGAIVNSQTVELATTAILQLTHSEQDKNAWKDIEVLHIETKTPDYNHLLSHHCGRASSEYG